jgi:hypothetical protein
MEKTKMFLLMIKFGYRVREDEALLSSTYSLEWGCNPNFEQNKEG